MRDLKPCPFCGQLPDIADADFCYPITRLDKDRKQIWRAGCIENAGGCGAEVTGWNYNEAIYNWNTRTNEPTND